ncbi:sigma factor-like helix-turn-helix DNA-binding protein [Nonomuraea sp. B1E8]|uniref:sigma factor-like helix-turn-helix DNA-binding protein n=1 Tax=unclassified Nonomuraea TaxID=2593643 RepID=UPI00325DDF81
MSQPLTDQRPRAELIAELYDRHAAGLFAYCADQLGDLGSASDVLVAVLTGVPVAQPPRAALYAFARREIHRRDIVYSPPAVDPLIDPATALVERVLRELRPHQREVLVLSAVCGLSRAELAWVLDIAPDTADELTMAAANRFRESLGTALAATGIRVPKPVADVYGALHVAPLHDVLGRLPWPQPPGALRIHFAGSRSAAPGPLFVKPRWPSPPRWPQPLAEADPATSTVIFPAELLTPPPPAQVPEHDATTAPMPKFRESTDDHHRLRDPLGSIRPLRDPLGGPWPSSSQAGERPFFMAAPDPGGPGPFATGDVILPKDAPDPYMTGDVLVHKGPARAVPPPPRGEDEVREAAPLFRPRTRTGGKAAAGPAAAPAPAVPTPSTTPATPSEPVYRLPDLQKDPLSKEAPAGEPSAFEPSASEPSARETSVLAPRPVRARPAPKRRPAPVGPQKARRRRDRHYDWAWELVGFLMCVAIAMIVFFSMPIFNG